MSTLETLINVPTLLMFHQQFFGQKSARLPRIWMKIGGKSAPGRPASVPGGSGGDSGGPGVVFARKAFRNVNIDF